jgi:hypothetical protein
MSASARAIANMSVDLCYDHAGNVALRTKRAMTRVTPQ